MTIKSELTKLDKKALIEIITDLYKKNKSVQDYINLYIKPGDESGLLQKYSANVYEAFFPKRGYGYNLKAGKQAISDFKKLGTSPESVASLLLFYVETGVQFTNNFGDIDETFYNILESTYNNALKLLRKEGISGQFEQRARDIMNNTENIGWGFHDVITDIFHNNY